MKAGSLRRSLRGLEGENALTRRGKTTSIKGRKGAQAVHGEISGESLPHSEKTPFEWLGGRGPPLFACYRQSQTLGEEGCRNHLKTSHTRGARASNEGEHRATCERGATEGAQSRGQGRAQSRAQSRDDAALNQRKVITHKLLLDGGSVPPTIHVILHPIPAALRRRGNIPDFSLHAAPEILPGAATANLDTLLAHTRSLRKPVISR